MKMSNVMVHIMHDYPLCFSFANGVFWTYSLLASFLGFSGVKVPKKLGWCLVVEDIPTICKALSSNPQHH